MAEYLSDIQTIERMLDDFDKQIIIQIEETKHHQQILDMQRQQLCQMRAWLKEKSRQMCTSETTVSETAGHSGGMATDNPAKSVPKQEKHSSKECSEQIPPLSDGISKASVIAAETVLKGLLAMHPAWSWEHNSDGNLCITAEALEILLCPGTSLKVRILAKRRESRRQMEMIEKLNHSQETWQISFDHGIVTCISEFDPAMESCAVVAYCEAAMKNYFRNEYKKAL